MKSLLRTWIALLLCAATLLCAVACGSEKIAPTANEESASEETGESTDTTEEVKMTDANETLAPTETVTDTAHVEMMGLIGAGNNPMVKQPQVVLMTGRSSCSY